MSTRTIKEENELANVAEEIISILPQKNTAHVIALSGELGAGKTAFVKMLGKQLGIVEHITSPTFVIMKKYDIPNHFLASTLVHIDAYRIEDVAEMNVIGLEELATKKDSIICIEWPERIIDLIPKDAISLRIDINSGGARTITYGD